MYVFSLLLYATVACLLITQVQYLHGKHDIPTIHTIVCMHCKHCNYSMGTFV